MFTSSGLLCLLFIQLQKKREIKPKRGNKGKDAKGHCCSGGVSLCWGWQREGTAPQNMWGQPQNVWGRPPNVWGCPPTLSLPAFPGVLVQEGEGMGQPRIRPSRSSSEQGLGPWQGVLQSHPTPELGGH